MIEGSPALAARAAEYYRSRPAVTVRQAFITAENIAHILTESAVPVELDLLSIDIDGNDYWVWRALDA